MRLLLALCAALAVAGCGGDEEEIGLPTGPADATERRASLGGVEYTVNLFRQLNLDDEPDAAYYDGPSPPGGSGLYGVLGFVRRDGRTWTLSEL